MARDLRIGDAVQTPAGKQVVIALSPSYVTTATRADVDTLYARDALYPHEWTHDEVEPLPTDIPRERVADLHAAVTKRIEQLASHCRVVAANGGGDAGAEARRAELQWVTEALRLLLEVPDAD